MSRPCCGNIQDWPHLAQPHQIQEDFNDNVMLKIVSHLTDCLTKLIFLYVNKIRYSFIAICNLTLLIITFFKFKPAL